MVKKLFLVAALAALALALGLVLSCSSGGDDDDSSSDDDNTGDDDFDCDIANPLPASECGTICNEEACSSDNPAYDCMNEGGSATVDECIADCMEGCQAGCVPDNILECVAAFTDCDAFYDCLGVNPES